MKLRGRISQGLPESADGLQMISCLALTLIAGFFGALPWGMSAFVGGATAILYQLYLGRVWQRTATLPPMEGVALLQRASMWRWLAVVGMVILALRTDFWHLWWLLGSFFWGQALFYISLALGGPQGPRPPGPPEDRG